MGRLLVIVALAGSAACGSGPKQPKSWRDDWGKPCFADADCGGALYCLNPGESVGSGAAVDTRVPECPAGQGYCDGACTATCTPTPPPAVESCEPTTCEQSGGRCADNACVEQGTCEPPAA
jgi:hypothetical protein